MVKSTKKKSNYDDGDEIKDERFTAAATHPQFQKGRRTHHHTNSRPRKNEQGDNSNANNKTLQNANSGNNDDDDDDDGGSLVINSINNDGGTGVGGSSGLGASLTEAIASDDRFKAALLDEDKFGCVPSRDKYGRKTNKKTKKKQSKSSSREDGDEEEDGEDGSEDEEKQQEDSEEGEEEEQDNSMEARIAYLNALSRGDISASSSSEDDDDSSEDGESDDDDDDSSTSSKDDVYGKSGIFDPNHAPLPGDHISDNEQQQANNDNDDDDAYEEAAELTHEPSPHLCILNLNWEHTRAVDVYAMLHSFCPPGTLKTVEVYPSDFGRERMAKERVEGPTGLWKRDKQKNNEKSGEAEDGNGEGKFWSSDDESNGSEDGNESLSDQDDAKLNEKDASDDEHDSDLDSDNGSDDEDIHNLAEATSKLYAHFPPQSTIMKNSQLRTEEEEEEGFDIEKLREYEASKLRYYFAIATFTSPSAAGTVYENVDGMEMEHSAAEIDVRVLPVEAYESTVEDRPLRDECHKLPAKYIPPENVVTTALRQSRVTCSWERGDTDREKKLTNWGMGKDAWEAMAEGDDIGLYLATSDNSSVGSESEEEDGEHENDVAVAVDEKKKKKGAGMRAMLGLAGSDDDDDGSVDVEKLLEDQSISEDSSGGSGESSADEMEDVAVSKKKHSKKKASPDTESESDSEDDEVDTKQVTFIPGKCNLEDKIRSKLHSKHNGGADNTGDDEQLSPFEKYLEKRREKRRERKKAAKEGAKGRDADDDESLDDKNAVGNDDDGMYGVDSEFGMAQFSDEEEGDATTSKRDFGTGETGDDDGFFLGESTTSSSTKKKGKNSKRKEKRRLESGADDGTKLASTKEELALLIAGDDDDEQNRDYDIRGLTKLERHANKKLKGKRKRQMDTLAANVSGQDFTIDTSDSRFAALLDGGDDRFGIDRTNPSYKETGAMKTLLQEQSKRRRNPKKSKKDGSNKKDEKVVDSGGGWVEKSSGAMELSSLVKSLQSKVSKGDDSGPKKKRKKTSKILQ